MAEVKRDLTIALPARQVWDFVSDVNIWASDMPGYRSHQVVSKEESKWIITGDVGILAREVELRVLITEWVDLERVTFSVEGTEEPVKGHGTFTVLSNGDQETTLNFFMSLSASGVMGPVINVLLKGVAPRYCNHFVSKLSKHILSHFGELVPSGSDA